MKDGVCLFERIGNYSRESDLKRLKKVKNPAKFHRRSVNIGEKDLDLVRSRPHRRKKLADFGKN